MVRSRLVGVLFVTIICIGAVSTVTRRTVERNTSSTVTETRIDIPTVRYAHLLTPCGPYQLPCLNVSDVDYTDVVRVSHDVVLLENAYVRVTILPKMGRVYRIENKITGHDILWRNNIAAPNGANNDLGWWIWIGGIEYTLPGEEHGYTWALDWNYSKSTLELSDGVGHSEEPIKAAITTSVTEPSTGMVETLTFSLDSESMSLDTHVHLHNPSAQTAYFAHWTNVPFVPGPRNRLPDSTEFIVPTKSISVESRWQHNLGPGLQNWTTSPLRYFANWINGTRMGDFTANGFLNLTTDTTSFFGAFSHVDNEGGVRVFDKKLTPGLDTWTYGYHPKEPCFPQNRNISRCSYAEMWGGTVMKLEHLKSLAPGKSIAWTEHVAPFHDIEGLSYANKWFCANTKTDSNESNAVILLHPIRAMEDVKVHVGIQSENLGDVSPGKSRRVVFDRRESGPLTVLVTASGSSIGMFPFSV